MNGLQVAPAELEAALLEHDDIADAAAVGITMSVISHLSNKNLSAGFLMQSSPETTKNSRAPTS